MKEHDEANKILDMKTREEQVEYYRALEPMHFRLAVGNWVKQAQDMEKDNRHFAWRVYRDEV